MALWKRIFEVLIAFLLLPAICCCAVSEQTADPTEEATDETAAVDLYIYIYDPCGGCGMDDPGCGNCEETVRYHGIIKGQLGDRLYEGTITYRMLNTRLLANYDDYLEFFESYGVHEELLGYLPTIYIGREGSGIFMVGEEMLDHIGEMLDAYISGQDVAEIQQEIDLLYEQIQLEKAQK